MPKLVPAYQRYAPDVTWQNKVLSNPFFAYDPYQYKWQRPATQMLVRGHYPGYEVPATLHSFGDVKGVVSNIGTGLAIAASTIFVGWLAHKILHINEVI